MNEYKAVSIIRIEHATPSCCEDLIVAEVPLRILVNGEKYATLMCTPSALDYLVVGNLLANGLIDSPADILSLDIDEEKVIASVILPYAVSPAAQERAVTTGCGLGELYLEVIQTCQLNNSTIIISATALLKHVADFNKMSDLFQQTGGAHSAAIYKKDAILLFHEDIGRHNAVDKLIGEAVSQKISLADKILITSGRISSEILLKAAKQSIPIIVSRSSPTTLAVELAKRLNITLVGFARGNRMNIYAGENRIDT